MSSPQLAPLVPSLAETLGSRKTLQIARFSVGASSYRMRLTWDLPREHVYLQIRDDSTPNPRWESVLRRPKETHTWRAIQFVTQHMLPEGTQLLLQPHINL